jgi:hypothetical protein
MEEILRMLESLRIHTEESVRCSAGDQDPKFFWSGYGCIVLRNKLRSLIEKELRFENRNARVLGFKMPRLVIRLS